MARVPSPSEIDAMSEEELDAYLASAQAGPTGPGRPGGQASPARPGPHGGGTDPATGPLALGGAPRSYALLMLVLAAIGLAACWELMLAELQQLREPEQALICDVNPLISCGASLNVWQGNLLGVPNSFVGAMGMTAVALFAVLLATGTRLPRWLWWSMSAGMLAALAFVAWFVLTSVTVFAKLCPFCMVIWAVVIPMAWNTWARAAQGGHLPLGQGATEALAANRWWLTALTYLVVALACVLPMWETWSRVLGL